MRGLIPLNILIPHCPIGKVGQLVNEWESAYGEPWPITFNNTRSPVLQNLVLSKFNGRSIHVSKIKIPGVSKMQVTKACIHLFEKGLLLRSEKVRGFYRLPKHTTPK